MTSSRRFAIPPHRETNNPTHLVVGICTGPHGIQGEVKIRPLTEFPERLRKFRLLQLRDSEGTITDHRVRAVRVHADSILFKLEGVKDRTGAEALRGLDVVVPVEDAAPLPEGRYYEHQILGLRVVTPEGEELGEVEQIMRLASNDVYVAGKFLIPATRDAVVRLAPEEGLLVVRSREYLEGEAAL